jgi:hypothetical membrane protein
MPTARRILTVLVPSGSLVFLFSLSISSIFFYSNKPFKLHDAVISELQSPEDNPRGYRIACAGTTLSAILFLPAGVFFFRTLLRRHRPIAAIGSVIYTLGLIAAILIGCLAPFPAVYDYVHLPLAYSAFIAILTGLLISLVCATSPPSRGILLLDFILLGLVLFVFYRVLGPDSNDVALDEWALSACIAAYTAILAAVLKPPTR